MEDINQYLEQIPTIPDQNNKRIAAILTNSDPFTLGQGKLFEIAQQENDLIYCIIAANDKAMFTQEQRVGFAESDLARYNNVKVISGKDLIPDFSVSIEFFKDQFAPKLNISRVYVGKKFLSMDNHFDNVSLAHELGPDIEVITIPDLEVNGQTVSASEVRKNIMDNNFKAIRPFVSEAVFKDIQQDL
ncbi:hypothetical protein [Lactobacillus sp. PSON]|uniref:hypothetical protein n=1 Tax=Lactobacillus sp. PSON TaxID=3455454 RepID=UPI00404232F1